MRKKMRTALADAVSNHVCLCGSDKFRRFIYAVKLSLIELILISLQPSTRIILIFNIKEEVFGYFCCEIYQIEMAEVAEEECALYNISWDI